MPALPEPQALYLEITDRCNMACPMCMTREHRKERRTSLDRETLRDRLLKPCRALGLSALAISGGEPTLAPHLLDTLNDAVNLDYNVFLATNLLSVDARLLRDVLRLLNDPRHALLVSFDSAEEDEMNAIRGRNVFKQVVANCREMLSMHAASGNRCLTYACIVLQPDNVRSITSSTRFVLDDLGFSRVVIQPRHDYSGVTLDTYRRQPFHPYPETVRRDLESAAKELFEMASLDARILMTNGPLANWLQFYEDPLRLQGPCKATAHVYVDAYGNYRGCLYGDVLANLAEMDVPIYLASPQFDQFKRLTRVCKICIHGCS